MKFMKLCINEQNVEIEVKNPGVLEVPEGKNVEDLPIKHFVAIADRKGLGAVTKALNNLQVWNKKKNPSLSKWAGDMIDKVTKRVENQRKNESLNKINEATLQDWQDTIMKEVYNVLRNNRIYGDVYEDYNFTDDNSFVMCVEINDGDWKHEHRRADLIISDLLDNYDNISVTKLKEEVTSDSEDDTYSAIHKYMVIKYNDMTEGCHTTEDTLTEFSSNFDGTEFDEVEFYSDDLKNVPKQTISNRIEALCSFPINIYDIEIDTMGTLIISYEVKEEDYNPDVIEATIIDILEGMEDNIRASRPVRAESISKKYVKAMRNRKTVKEDYDIDFDAITIPKDERYEYIKSKTVLDSGGWQTDYTMYYDWEDDKYIFIFGDNDVYDPTNESPDWECDTEQEANNWFNNYTGFEDDDLDESCNMVELSKCSAEIIGHRNYDGIHAFVIHSPIFNDYSYINKLRKVMPEYRIDTTGFNDEVAIFADENELSDIQKYIKRFNTKYCEDSLDESCGRRDLL